MAMLDAGLDLLSRLVRTRRKNENNGTIAQLKRDIQSVTSGLRGAGAPPFTHRSGEGFLTISAPKGLLPRTVRVLRIERESPDAVSIVLVDTEEKAIDFTPGQFFTVVLEIGGEVLRRAYSASCTPETASPPGSIRLTIKRISGGRVSNYLNDSLRVGDLLGLFGPSGNYVLAAKRSASPLLLVAGGSGATPMIALATEALKRTPDRKVVLIDGNRSEADILFRGEFGALVERHPTNFVVRHVLFDPPPGWFGGRGMLDAPTLQREVADLQSRHGFDAASAEIYLCGPEPMMRAARSALSEHGCRPEQIHEEKFTSPQLRSAVRNASSSTERLSIKRGLAVLNTEIHPGQTLLEASLASGIAMPFSCTLGGCGACRVHLEDGEVAVEEPNCLTSDERAEGYILACVARPRGPITVQLA